jgi:hypothetical protein
LIFKDVRGTGDTKIYKIRILHLREANPREEVDIGKCHMWQRAGRQEVPNYLENLLIAPKEAY